MLQGPIHIVIADDHEIFREGFKLLLKNQQELILVGEAENGKELLEVTARQTPDIVITDIKMPVLDGIDACKQIRRQFPSIDVIALSMFNEDNLIIDMLDAGAKGYLLKNTNKAELLLAVRTVFEGNNYYCNATSNKLAKMIATSKYNPHRAPDVTRFTDREKQIIHLICEQNSNKEIASALHLSIRTVESHRERIMEKCGARNVIGVVVYAIRNELFVV